MRECWVKRAENARSFRWRIRARMLGLFSCAWLVASTLTLASAAPAIYVADKGLDNYGWILWVDPATGSQSYVAFGNLIRNPTGIAVGPDHALYVVQENRTVVRIDPATGDQRLVTSDGLLVSPFSIVAGPDGALYVTDMQAPSMGDGAIIRIDPNTGEQRVVSMGGELANPLGIAMADAGTLVVADYSDAPRGSALIRIDATTGAQSVIASGPPLNVPFGIHRDGTDLFVTDMGALLPEKLAPAVFRVNSITGVVSVVSCGGLMQGAWFAEPTGLVRESAEALLVIDPGSRVLIRVELATGTQSRVSGAQYFYQPYAIALDPEPPTAVIHTTLGSVKARYR